MTKQVEQWICIRFCVKLECSSAETIWMIQKAFGDDAKSAAQIKVWHKRFKDGWEFVESDPCSGRPATGRTPEYTGYNQQRLATGSVRTRSWSGDSKNYCVRDFDAGSWQETCRGKICSMASATGVEGISCCSWESCVRSQGTYFEGDWGIIVLCIIFLISYIFFNKCLFFILHGLVLSGQTSLLTTD